jgi:hypothetical protein
MSVCTSVSEVASLLDLTYDALTLWMISTEAVSNRCRGLRSRAPPSAPRIAIIRQSACASGF